MASEDYRVGILSDIHGNLIPLRFAHNHLRRLGVDTVICAGDVASFGPDPNDAISFLADNAIPTACGNEDEALLSDITIPSDASRRMRQLCAIRAWSQAKLSPTSKDWLSHLPGSIALDPGLLCVHASPGDNQNAIAENDPKPFPTGITLLAAGHRHVPFVDTHLDRTWVNIGSVGRPGDGDPRSAMVIASVRNSRWSVRIIRLDVPLHDMCSRIRRAQMPFADRLCETQLKACSW